MMLSHPRGHPCITGFQQKKEEEKSSSFSPSLDVTRAGGSCSANPVGIFLGGTVEGLQDSPPAVTCPTAHVGAEGGRQQLIEGSVSPFPFQGEKQELGRAGHILQVHPQLLKGG